MNTFGTLLLRIERPWLGVPLPATSLVTACQDVTSEVRDEEPAAANDTEGRDSIGEPSSTFTIDSQPESVTN